MLWAIPAGCAWQSTSAMPILRPAFRRMTKSPSFRPLPGVEMRLRVAIQTAMFDLATEIAALSAGGVTGAVVSFTGHVRDDDGLASLSLEHYPGMTEAEI